MSGPRLAPPAAWRRAALSPPRALGPPEARGRLKAEPAHFRVEEKLGFAPDGGEAHLLLRVEKTDANTLFVARRLADAAGVHPRDVGFAGLKDRRAVATQWFSLPAGRRPRDWVGFEGPGFRVLEAAAHSRKLRRGALAGNRFEVVVTGLTCGREELERRLAAVLARGVPNYFGLQRFGRDGANLTPVAAWAAGGPLPSRREERGFLLSAARALAFNAVLAARVADGTWNRLLPGEVVNLGGSGSVFVATEIDAALAARCDALDVHPTGPLPGTGGLAPCGRAARVEAEALAPLAELVAALAAVGLEAARRPLRVRPDALDYAVEPGRLVLAFELPRGAFATSLLAELVEFPADGAEGCDPD